MLVRDTGIEPVMHCAVRFLALVFFCGFVVCMAYPTRPVRS
jgi:hypothetical protein